MALSALCRPIGTSQLKRFTDSHDTHAGDIRNEVSRYSAKLVRDGVVIERSYRVAPGLKRIQTTNDRVPKHLSDLLPRSQNRIRLFRGKFRVDLGNKRKRHVALLEFERKSARERSQEKIVSNPNSPIAKIAHAYVDSSIEAINMQSRTPFRHGPESNNDAQRTCH